METVNTFYSKRVWLNPNNSPSTGNIIAFDDIETIDGKPYISQFFKISDCYHIANIHKAEYDTEEDFLNKMILMRDEINLFIEHLKNKKENKDE